MAGLIKCQEYDWKDSNLALFGSDLERQIKKASAQSETAWKTAGQEVGLEIWRIVNFKVTPWPKEDYGKFYDGDSYIVLNTYKESGKEQFLYDVHFWIGKYSTQDEYGTAAYKTVELDTYLDDVPIQHREVQGFESNLFKSYFKTIELLKGGATSGFKNVKPAEYRPRLLHFHGERKNIFVKEVARNVNVLDNSDVYILDLGLKLLQWNGSGSNKDERFKEFTQYLTEQNEDEVIFYCNNKTRELFRLSDALGKLTFSLEKSGKINKSDFDSKDVFVFDIKTELFVWIGKETSPAEKKNALAYAHSYLQKTDHPLVPVSCIREGRTVESFETALAA
ncbi:gelsolin-like protein 2 isoform X2 [Biomphalaria glabrata]|uniref:Actin-modulator n=1 Tax=Biomphalaria glabrata TaxID=6526 RepID=A0A9W3A4U2_BIOGL|nr:gelsolin-like protein 2 isoform X2 [Biomphalaria glabrata]